MANQRMINTKFWDDSYIMKLDPIEKLLFLYFITNPLTNISGIYEISLRRIAFDTGIDSEMIEKMLKRFEKENKIIYKNGWIRIVNFIKNQNQGSLDVQKGITREIEKVPENIRKSLKIGEGVGRVWGGSMDGGTLNLTKLNLTEPQKEEKPLKDKKIFIPVNWNHSFNRRKPYHSVGVGRFKLRLILAEDGEYYVIPKEEGSNYILKEDYLKTIKR